MVTDPPAEDAPRQNRQVYPITLTAETLGRSFIRRTIEQALSQINYPPKWGQRETLPSKHRDARYARSAAKRKKHRK